MRVLRWTLKLHKWVALIVAVQVLFWVVGGLFMSAVPIKRVHGDHKVRTLTAPDVVPETLISLTDAAAMAGLDVYSSAELSWQYDRWLWQISSPESVVFTVDALTGDLISPVTETEALRIARLDFNGEEVVTSIRLMDNPPDEYKRPPPVWQVKFADLDRTTIYIDPRSSDVTARRSRTWRTFDVFWKLHVMDWDDGNDINHPWLVGFAILSLIVVLAGIVLLFIRTRRLLLMRRHKRG